MERYQLPHRRKTPSFSSSLLDSILRSIDETNDHGGGGGGGGGGLHDDHQDIRFFPSEPKRSNQMHLIDGGQQQMMDQWMETHNVMSNNHIISAYNVSRKISWDSIASSSSTTSSSTTTYTYTSLPKSMKQKQTEAETYSQQPMSAIQRETKFMKSTKLRAMKIYKKVKQPISPTTRISTFLYSLFASSKKPKIHQTTTKSPSSSKHLPDSTCTSFSRSCITRKQQQQQQHHHNNSSSRVVKRSVRFYPDNDTLILDRKSINEPAPNLRPLPKYERRWFTDHKYMKNYKKFMINVEDDEEDDDDDLFELEIVGGVAYGRELPVFETTDLRKIRI